MSVFVLQIDNNYPKRTQINWYGCPETSNVQDTPIDEDMTEQEMMMQDDEMDIEVIDIHTGRLVFCSCPPTVACLFDS